MRPAETFGWAQQSLPSQQNQMLPPHSYMSHVGFHVDITRGCGIKVTLHMFMSGFPYREVEVMVLKSGNKAAAGELGFIVGSWHFCKPQMHLRSTLVPDLAQTTFSVQNVQICVFFKRKADHLHPCNCRAYPSIFQETVDSLQEFLWRPKPGRYF